MTDASRGPELTVLHRIRSGSNAVYRCVDARGDGWVYKPSAGERPLMDFPDGTLAAREVAAYVVSVGLGWDLVPETVLAHGPGGVGMAQRWIDERDPAEAGAPDPVDVHPVDSVPEGRAVVLRGEGARGEDVVVAHGTDERLRRIALFDLVVNNADRKGGHVLAGTDGRVYGVDHGLCLHAQDKLRTVLWGWAGQPIGGETLCDITKLLAALDGEFGAELAEHLTDAELAALGDRARGLLADPALPGPDQRARPIPWPAF